MKIKISIYFFVAVCIIQQASAQLLKPVALDEKTTYTSPSAEQLKEGAFVMKEQRFFDFVYDDSGDSELLKSYYFKIFVSTKDGVEAYNKLFFGVGSSVELMGLKVRVIKKDGSVIDTDKSQMKEVEDEDNGKYRQLAVEGLEENCILEYCYSYKTSPYFYGSEYIQTGTPKQLVEFRLSCPKNLVYNCIGYNDLPKFKIDTAEKKNIYTLTAENIPALKKQTYGYNDKYKKRVEFVLNENNASGKKNFFSYNEFAISFIKRMRTIEKSEDKAVTKLLKQLKITEKSLESVKALERYLKANIQQDNNSANPELEQIDKILSNKVGTATTLTKIYLSACTKLDIKTELVVAAERDGPQIDKSFETYTHLDEVMIYFPDFDMYVSPKNFYSRVGFPPSSLQSCDALYLKEISVGESFSAVAKVKLTDFVPSSKSTHDADVVVTLNVDSNYAKIDKTVTLKGYSAFYIQPVYQFLNDEAKKEMVTNLAVDEKDAQDTKFTYNVTNFNIEDVFEKPFTVKVNYKTSELIENAGNKLLLKAGMLIGPQSQLYQETDRVLPAEIEYTHTLNRKIVINIPKGYKISNPKDCILSKSCDVDGKQLAYFKSSYEEAENTITINCNEGYNVLFYPFSSYEAYKNVINAAADLNKIVLILEEK